VDKVEQAQKVIQDFKDIKVHKVIQDQQDIQAHKALKVLQVVLV
jgi:hypothetical protein